MIFIGIVVVMIFLVICDINNKLDQIKKAVDDEIKKFDNK